MARSKNRRERRGRGLTLVELLIVIAIMVLVVAASVRLVQPSFQGRKIREASRQLNAMFAGAKARAVERGRPFGVWFERTPGNLNQCLEVFLAEIPPPYCGDVADARCSFILDNNGTPSPADDFFRVSFNTAECASLFAQYGPLVQLNQSFWMKYEFRGRTYTVTRLPPNDAALGDDFRLAGGPPPVPANGARFQLYLPPRKSLAAPIDLLNGIAIDLSFSGLGAQGTEFDAYNPPPAMAAPTPSPDPNPVIVLFSPAGNVELVYSRGGPVVPYSEIHFLVGQSATIAPLDFANPTGPPNPRDSRNIQDQSNLWVTVGHRTGSLTTAENYFNAATPTVDVSRQFARTGQTKGGR